MTKKKNKKNTRPSSAAAPAIAIQSGETIESASRPIVAAHTIKGVDDSGNFYNGHEELATAQLRHQDEFYEANRLFWSSGGTGGKNDDEAMVGDGGSAADAADGLAFLDRYLSDNHDAKRRFDRAVDLGAGAGRVTKLILLKRYSEVRLVEGDEGWSKRSRVYLGRKRSERCSFSNQRLEDLTAGDVRNWGEPADLMWVQWTLQYLIDVDFVDCLRILSGGLRKGSGILIVKENRPYGVAREDRFQMDVPSTVGGNERYDLTRNDSHHRFLFHKAGLKVNFMERGEETNTYALSVSV
eukprot:CAMPEP_0113560366 /NCGR_PEP_ID=MMETSP0015_2-20120614/19392_1 /TAXON_ID=2838 /ORGANISM="Odontella" /LENGTH=296 /DNA_ID=CAMNT_0000462065 /DNA_START=62 /DNA_END=952 /DNA_ORIENTATION=+ /assembly_acc=CAM_ASM_000160